MPRTYPAVKIDRLLAADSPVLIRLLRRKLTQKELSIASGVPAAVICRIESEQRLSCSEANFASLQRLALEMKVIK